MVFCCHYCDPVTADGFSVVAVDLDEEQLTEMGVEHFNEGVAGQMGMAGGRLLLIGTLVPFTVQFR